MGLLRRRMVCRSATSWRACLALGSVFLASGCQLDLWDLLSQVHGSQHPDDGHGTGAPPSRDAGAHADSRVDAGSLADAGSASQPSEPEPSDDEPDASPSPPAHDAGSASAVDAGTSVERVDAGGCEPSRCAAGQRCDSSQTACVWELGLDTRPSATPFLALPPEGPERSSTWTTVPAFTQRFALTTRIQQAPRIGYLFVLGRDGALYAIQTNPAGQAARPILNLRDVTQGGSDAGLLGIAFHPDFGLRDSPNGRYFYLHYAYSARPVRPPVPTNTLHESRLARFSINLDTLVADRQSEQVLIAQQDEHTYHQGGAMFFHPRDGFLYLAVGDEGGSLCAYDNCQRIDRDLFGGVLRIDVDQRGGEISHPIPRQPESGATANYFIPNDNPFVGRDGVLEEFYALGSRSPHTMAHDPVDGLTWIGDVGQNVREEIDVLASGANFQWPLREGNFVRGEPPADPIGIWTDPIIDLPREDSVAVIGGFVYRGDKFPELYGKYLFGDLMGKVWALGYDYDGQSVQATSRELLLSGFGAGDRLLTSFATDDSGEIYLAEHNSNIWRLQHQNGSAEMPARLSATGAFVDTATLEPAPGLMPYSVNNPLWSDGASKRRWIAVPDGGSVQFAPDGPWSFPEGTVFVKHFEMALDERQPLQKRRLETRFLVAGREGNFYGISYKWNAAGTDAEPQYERVIEPLSIVQADGSVRVQNYMYPSPADCMVCHNADAGHVLGVRTAQLNGLFVYEHTGREAQQLLTWGALGLLDGFEPDALDSYPRLVALDDESRSLEERVRSYWDSNCSSCHGVSENIRAQWDARQQVPLAEQGVVGGPVLGNVRVDGGFIVAPGAPERSLMWLRDKSVDPTERMPPLGRNRPDDRYLALLEAWIRSLEP